MTPENDPLFETPIMEEIEHLNQLEVLDALLKGKEADNPPISRPMTPSEILSAMPLTRAIILWARVLQGVHIHVLIRREEDGVSIRIRWPDRRSDSGNSLISGYIFYAPEQEDDPELREFMLAIKDHDVSVALNQYLVAPLLRGEI